MIVAWTGGAYFFITTRFSRFIQKIILILACGASGRRGFFVECVHAIYRARAGLMRIAAGRSHCAPPAMVGEWVRLRLWSSGADA